MILRWLLLFLLRRARQHGLRVRRWGAQRVVTFDDKFLFWRFQPFWPDEWISKKTGKHFNRPPWWRPFNILLHQWAPEPGTREGWHGMIEHTPWGGKVLTPGSVVVRSRKFIHAFSIPEGFSGKTWIVFIVGRRNYAQNSYVVTPQGRGV